jgi:hypothetical protein
MSFDEKVVDPKRRRGRGTVCACLAMGPFLATHHHDCLHGASLRLVVRPVVVSLIAMGGAAAMVIDLAPGPVRRGVREETDEPAQTSTVCADDDDDVRMSLESFLRSTGTSVLTLLRRKLWTLRWTPSPVA